MEIFAYICTLCCEHVCLFLHGSFYAHFKWSFIHSFQFWLIKHWNVFRVDSTQWENLLLKDMVKHDPACYRIDGWPLHARMCTQLSPESNTVRTLDPTKVLWMNYKRRFCVYMHAKEITFVCISEFSGLWKRLKHPTCTVDCVAQLPQLAFPG